MSSASRSAADPLARLALRTRLTVGAGVPLLGGLLLWALWPLGSAALEADTPAAEASTLDEVETGGIDPAVFEVRLWSSGAGAEVASAEPAPAVNTAPLRLQLVGVIEEEGELIAALYDPDKDELRLVRDGMSIGSHRVTGITLAGVTLNDGGAKLELRLQRETP